MVDSDKLRYTKLPLNNGSTGAIYPPLALAH